MVFNFIFLNFLLLFNLFITINGCSCALGYRNGAASSDINLCMGPAEGGKRPCYPTPCNSDWTPCTRQEQTNTCPYWKKETTNNGKRPDCSFVPIGSNDANYLWGTLKQCKNKCLNE